MKTLTTLEWIKQIQNSKTTDCETKEWIQHLLDSNLEIDRIHGMVLREISRMYEESMGMTKHKNYVSE